MKAELLERLLDAGFTKDDIIQLARDEPVKQEGGPDDEKIEHPGEPESHDEAKTGTSEQSTSGNVAEHQTETGTKTESDNNTGSAFETRLEGIEKRIGDLIKAVQTSNLKNDSIKNPSDTLEDETDKIMRSIIRPEVEKKG